MIKLEINKCRDRGVSLRALLLFFLNCVHCSMAIFKQSSKKQSMTHVQVMTVLVLLITQT